MKFDIIEFTSVCKQQWHLRFNDRSAQIHLFTKFHWISMKIPSLIKDHFINELHSTVTRMYQWSIQWHPIFVLSFWVSYCVDIIRLSFLFLAMILKFVYFLFSIWILCVLRISNGRSKNERNSSKITFTNKQTNKPSFIVIEFKTIVSKTKENNYPNTKIHGAKHSYTFVINESTNLRFEEILWHSFSITFILYIILYFRTAIHHFPFAILPWINQKLDRIVCSRICSSMMKLFA